MRHRLALDLEATVDSPAGTEVHAHQAAAIIRQHNGIEAGHRPVSKLHAKHRAPKAHAIFLNCLICIHTMNRRHSYQTHSREHPVNCGVIYARVYQSPGNKKGSPPGWTPLKHLLE